MPMPQAARCLPSLLAFLGFALLAPGCAGPEIAAPVVTSAWDTHTGQLMYRPKTGRSIIGEFVVREAKDQGFVLHFSAGPGIPLMKLEKTPAGVTAEGVLARGKWRGAAASAPRHLRGWIALEEVFAQLPARGETLSGTGWTARISRETGDGTNVDVTVAPPGERFVFHVAR